MDRQTLMHETEKALRAACHKRDEEKCQRCELINWKCDVAHILPRARCGKLKFALCNVLLACRACHQDMDSNQAMKEHWFRRHWHKRWLVIQETLDDCDVPDLWLIKQREALLAYADCTWRPLDYCHFWENVHRELEQRPYGGKAQFAREIGISNQYLSTLRTNPRNTSSTTMVAAANVLKVPLDQLLQAAPL